MLHDLKGFYDKTKHRNVSVICLTATVDDGAEKGVEKEALQVLQYKIYTNSKATSLQPPRIHANHNFREIATIKKHIEEQALKRGVLVYATGDTFKQVKALEGVTAVTKQTPDNDLRQMGVKGKDSKYPVYLINEFYGTRGLDFNSPGNTLGICMLILNEFSGKRQRMQALTRVGRYGEECYRIQNNFCNHTNE